MARLDIYWSFRSPYSYLAIDRLVAIKRDFNVDIDFRPVPREAQRLGIAFANAEP